MGGSIQSSHAINDVVYRFQQNPKSRRIVVQLHCLTAHREPLRTRGLKESNGSSWRVIVARTKPWGRDGRPITDITSTALGKEKIVACL
jgi:hypothetical protein